MLFMHSFVTAALFLTVMPDSGPGSIDGQRSTDDSPASITDREVASHSITIEIGSSTKSVAQLRVEYRRLEAQSQELAAELRSGVASSDDADEKQTRKALRDAIAAALSARQMLQRAELAEFAQRLRSIQQSIETRDRLADRIIDRRVDELLDPNLQWESGDFRLPKSAADDRTDDHASDGLDTPQATLTLLTKHANRKNFHGFISLLTDDEAKRTAGMLLQSGAMIGVVTGLLSQSPEGAGSPDQPFLVETPATIERFKNPDAPLHANLAFQRLTVHSTVMVVRQFGGELSEPGPVDGVPSTPAEYSVLLRTAAGVLTDPREFCAEMMRVMDDRGEATETTTQPQWNITVSDNHAVAVDANSAGDGEKGLLKATVVELTRVDGRWLISSLIADAQLTEFMTGPSVSATPDISVTQALPAESTIADFQTPSESAGPQPTYYPGVSDSNADDALPPIRWDAEGSATPPIRDEAWGQEHDGLRLAIRTVTENTPSDSMMEVLCVIQNVTQSPIELVDDGWSLSVECDVRRTSKAQVQTIPSAMSGAVFPTRLLLNPGQQMVVARTRIRVTDDIDAEQTPKNTDLLIVDKNSSKFRNVVYVLRCGLRAKLSGDADSQISLISEQIAIAFSRPEQETPKS
jgi:hypothetical protein